MYIINCLKHS